MKQLDPLPARWPFSVAYEVFVQSFCDSNGDGIGDLNGLTSKLDYLKGLGVEALWLMPIHPSPSYHKYDVTDYFGIHPDYGTLADFRTLVKEAHHRGIKVIMDLMINHCSRLHPWFTSSLNPDSPYRNYFIWASQEEIEHNGGLLKEESADSDNIYLWNQIPGQDKLYYSFFGSGMPDLNHDNPSVREEMHKIGEYWLKEADVDGFRLDAAKHIFPDHRAADTHAFWQAFKARMQSVKADVYLIGEVWSDLREQLPYASGFSSLFNFDLAASILESIKKEQIVNANIYKNTWKVIRKGSPATLCRRSETAFNKINPDFINAVFLTNHDQERVMSFLNNHEEKAKLAASILLTLSGTAFIYYGEELGMKGKKPDPHIREPFPWKQGKSSETATWLKPAYNLPKKTHSLEVQWNDPSSMYHHYHKLIHFRRTNPVMAFGKLVPAKTEDPQLLAWYRSYKKETLLVIHNLSPENKKVQLPKEDYHQCEFTTAKDCEYKNEILVLPPYKSMVLSKP